MILGFKGQGLITTLLFPGASVFHEHFSFLLVFDVHQTVDGLQESGRGKNVYVWCDTRVI